MYITEGTLSTQTLIGNNTYLCTLEGKQPVPDSYMSAG